MWNCNFSRFGFFLKYLLKIRLYLVICTYVHTPHICIYAYLKFPKTHHTFKLGQIFLGPLPFVYAVSQASHDKENPVGLQGSDIPHGGHFLHTK